MNDTDTSKPSRSSSDWQLLGELELTVNPDTDRTIGNWLRVILGILNLHPDFMSKVLKSAQEAAARAIQTETVIRFEHTHLLIFAPKEGASKGRTWGFFRIEKIDNPSEAVSPNHSIEFYLYLEG